MKKIYINPEMKIVNIQTQQIIASSDESDEVRVGGVYSDGEIQSRRRGFNWNNDAGGDDDE